MAKKKVNDASKHPAKKTTKTKSGSSATGKNKQEKRSSTASVSADLTLPKEPDPQTTMNVDLQSKREAIEEVMSFALETEFNLWFLRKLAHDVDETTMQGNDRFRRIADAYADRWTEAPRTFDDTVDIKKKSTTVEKAMSYIHDLVQKNNIYLMTALLKFLDPDQVTEHDEDEVWEIRQVCVGVAQQSPSTFFKYEEAVADKDSRARNFWNLSNPENPILDSECLAVYFWAATSFILGHPWRTNYHFTRLQGEQNVLDVPNASKGSGDPHQDAVTNWLNLSPTLSNSLRSQSPATVNSTSSNPELDAKFGDLSVDVPKHTVKRRKSGLATNSKSSLQKSRQKVQFETEYQSLPHKRRESEDAIMKSVHNDEDLSSQSSVKSDDVDKLEDEQLMELETESESEAEQPAKTSTSVGSNATAMEEDSPHPQTNSPSYSEIASKATESNDNDLPLAERIQRLRQVNLEGLACQVHLFQPTFSIMWNGSSGKKNIADSWVRNIVDALAEGFQHSEAGLRLLPLSDTEYKTKCLWIRNEAELRAKIKNVKHLRKYMDMEFGNAQAGPFRMGRQAKNSSERGCDSDLTLINLQRRS